MSVHIPYDQVVQPYHIVVGGLVSKYVVHGGEILDVGCGVGHFLSIVKSHRGDLKLIAADIDQECLAITDQRVGLHGKLHINDVEDLFIDNKLYDCIVMSHSLEHMYAPVRVIKEMTKKIRPGGFLILAVPNPVRLPVIFSNIRRRRNVNLGHVVAWDRSHWMNFLEVILQLDVMEYAEDIFQLPFMLGSKFQFLRSLEWYLVKIFPWFSMSNIAVVRVPLIT